MAKTKARAQTARSFNDAQMVQLRRQMAKGEVGDRFTDLSNAIDELGQLEKKLAPVIIEVKRHKSLTDFIKNEMEELSLDHYAGKKYESKVQYGSWYWHFDTKRLKIYLGEKLALKYMKQSRKRSLITRKMGEE